MKWDPAHRTGLSTGLLRPLGQGLARLSPTSVPLSPSSRMGGPAPQPSARGPSRPRPPGPARAARSSQPASRSQPPACTAHRAQALLHVQRVYPRDTAPPAVPGPRPRLAPPRRGRGSAVGTLARAAAAARRWGPRARPRAVPTLAMKTERAAPCPGQSGVREARGRTLGQVGLRGSAGCAPR